MKKIFVFILLLMSQLVFAGNSVSYLGLNGPVKCYKAHSQVYYFDEAGYLTHVFSRSNDNFTYFCINRGETSLCLQRN